MLLVLHVYPSKLGRWWQRDGDRESTGKSKGKKKKKTKKRFMQKM
jgi:hypothetical protein